MKNKGILITMETPCSEDWNSMTATEKGMFCSQCSKHVQDFRYSSDEEIIKVVNNSNGRLCGHLRSDQLNRVMHPAPVPSTSSFFARIFSIFILFATTIGASCKQQKPPVVMQPTIPSEKKEEEVLRTDTVKHTIQGTLYDGVTKRPIAALVVLKHTGLSTISNDQGHFEFSISEKDIKDDMILEISVVGFKNIDVTIYKTNLTNIKLYITPEPAETPIMGRICVRPLKDIKEKKNEK